VGRYIMKRRHYIQKNSPGRMTGGVIGGCVIISVNDERRECEYSRMDRARYMSMLGSGPGFYYGSLQSRRTWRR
jgi:hypothetical protein